MMMVMMIATSNRSKGLSFLVVVVVGDGGGHLLL